MWDSPSRAPQADEITGERQSKYPRMDETRVPNQAEGTSHNTPAAERRIQNHNQVAEPCQETEYQPRYLDLRTNKGTLNNCTEYILEQRRRLADKENQLIASQQECQEANRALSYARAELAQQQGRIVGCQMKIRGLTNKITRIKANTQSMFKKLSEDFDRQLAEVHAEISTIISQLPSPPESPEPPSVV